ncbi:endonuclease/exonuclease/phosphatase family protein [Companilactobacillus sp. FL22-1]|uniref:endonuclease/exonuclease/phosphatase family protein n=1 Tax=Companilactobacillus sp. FL22-1 TaxID=3373892 RepID=UPI0037541020
MRAVCWNINLRSNTISEDAASFVVRNIQGSGSPDLVVLTEYVQSDILNNKLEKNGYAVYTDEDLKTKNGILIAINKQSNIKVKEVFNLKENVNDINPNFLGVRLISNGKHLNVVGTRIRIGGSNLTDDFKDRARQVTGLLNQLDIHNISGRTAIVGDFNNGWFDKKMNEVKEKYTGKPREYFNYGMLTSLMKCADFKVGTPKNGYSWGNGFNLDHIFFRDLSVKNSIYKWDFEQDPLYKHRVGYPDHAQLLTEIEL